MKHIPAVMAMMALLATSAASASAAAMSYPQLEACAGYTQRMQTEAPALLAQDRRNAELRNYYNAGNGSQDDKLAFNQQMQKYRQDVIALNQVKEAFAQQCAGRNARMSDVEKLPDALRQAWRRGLDHVEVPYLGPSTTP